MTADAEPAGGWQSPERQAALRVQLFLDKEGFGPGKIDGRWGGFSEKAALRWNASRKGMKITILENGGLDLAKVAQIPFSGELITTYTTVEKDHSLTGSFPPEPEEQAELKELPYASLMELVAEKFHADPDLIRELNSLAPDSDLEVGSELRVPNVSEPFDIAEPAALASKGTSDDAISPGANDNPSPEGKWKVYIISWMPEFRWDKSMLEDGKRSDEAYLLPPGPNNPVGIVWIGLNADGIGLHGTASPNAIGRNRSHGCIRLSNWDALKLAKSVIEGTPVTVK